MLKRIKIKGYKSLADVEVSLTPLTVLFGPNAAGKSNFLDALQLLSRVVTSRTLKEAFEPPYRGTPLESFTFGAEGIKGLVAQESAKFSIEVDVELSGAVVENVDRQIREMKRTKSTDEGPAKPSTSVRETRLRYRIEIEIMPRTGILRVADEFLTALNSQGKPTRKRSPFIERKGSHFMLRMERQGHPIHYDRHLDHAVLSMPHYWPHHPHVVAMQQELASWAFFYFEPRERMRSPSPVKEVRHIGLMGEDLASFLNTLRVKNIRQFQAVERSLRMLIPTITGLDIGVSDLGEVELRVVEGTTPIPARVLSEGTLRVLGLLALGSAKEPPALIGFEEPENGIPPQRIKLIAEFLKAQASGDSQIIVTTHSPILPDLLPDEQLFVCRKVERATVIEPFVKSFGSLGRKHDVDGALEELRVSERMLRGDFGG